MIASVDTQGEIYVALTTVNTDANVMLMFLSRLAIRLTQDDPGWRANTYILLDGASYHKCEETKKHMVKLGMQVILSAPYSYDASPAELLFAYFKQTNLNPNYLPTGKK